MVALPTGRSTPPAIDVRALSKLHGASPALLDVTFSIPRGLLVTVVGASGAGKSTLLKLLAGQIAPSGGRIRICGADARTHRIEMTSHVGYVPEARLACGALCPAEILDFSGRARRIARQALDRRLREVVHMCGLERHLHQPFHRIEAGGRVRVALAQALLHEPSVLLLDGLFAGLDAADADDIGFLVNALRQHTTIVVSGAPEALGRLAPDTVLVLERGRLASDAAGDNTQSTRTR